MGKTYKDQRKYEFKENMKDFSRKIKSGKVDWTQKFPREDWQDEGFTGMRSHAGRYNRNDSHSTTDYNKEE